MVSSQIYHNLICQLVLENGGSVSHALCRVFTKIFNGFCLANEADINMESSEPDYESDWPRIPNLLNSLEYVHDSCDDRTALHDMISRRYLVENVITFP